MLTNDHILSQKNNGDTNSIDNHNSRPESGLRTLSGTKSDWVLLNVGGKHFMTTRSTLSKEESFLCRLCQYEPDLKTDVVRTYISIDYFTLLFYGFLGRKRSVFNRS